MDKKYDNPDRLLWQFLGGAIILGAVGGEIFLLIATVIQDGYFNSNILTLPLCTLPMVFIVGFGFINIFPIIWVEQKGLRISYNFTQEKLVPWTDIIELRNEPLMGTRVIASRITPFHYFQGRFPRPGFVISQRTENRDELLRAIRRHGI